MALMVRLWQSGGEKKRCSINNTWWQVASTLALLAPVAVVLEQQQNSFDHLYLPFGMTTHRGGGSSHMSWHKSEG